MVAASGQDFQSSQLCFEWPHTMLNGTRVVAETDEALLSVYSNSTEHSGEIKSCSRDLCLYKDWKTSHETEIKFKNRADLFLWVPEGYLNPVGMQRSTYRAQSCFTCSPTIKSAIKGQNLFQQFELPWTKYSGNKFFEMCFHFLLREDFNVVFSPDLKKELVMPCRGYS